MKFNEIKFYEKIGIRKWKKFVLWLMAIIIPNRNPNIGTNYYLGGYNLKAVESYKIYIWFNALIHTFGLIYCFLCVCFGLIESDVTSFKMLLAIIIFIINLYCVILQRYNWLRIKKIQEKAALK